MPGKTCRSQLWTRAHTSPLSRSWTGMGPPSTWQRGFQGFSAPAQSLARSVQQMDHRGGKNRHLLCLTYLGTSKLFPLAAVPFYILISGVGEFQFLHVLTSPSLFFFLNYSHPQWESNTISQLSLDHMLHEPYSAGTQITDGHKGLNDTSFH